jgi:hypothetical protein
MKFKFSRHSFEKFSDIKFHENPSGGNRVVPIGRSEGRTKQQTDRDDETNNRFSQFCKRAK